MMSDEELNKLDFYFYKLEMVDELESMLKDSDIEFDGKNRGEAFEELQDLAFDRGPDRKQDRVILVQRD